MLVPRADPIMSDDAVRHFDLPALGTDQPRSHFKGGSEKFVSKLRREGLPLARLWENASALVSFGLNRKGQPGFWLVQKKREAAADSLMSPGFSEKVVAVGGTDFDRYMSAAAHERQWDLGTGRTQAPDAPKELGER